MLPPFGVMVRNNSITKRSSGVKAPSLALSNLPCMVLVKAARASGSPEFFPSFSMML